MMSIKKRKSRTRSKYMKAQASVYSKNVSLKGMRKEMMIWLTRMIAV